MGPDVRVTLPGIRAQTRKPWRALRGWLSAKESSAESQDAAGPQQVAWALMAALTFAIVTVFLSGQGERATHYWYLYATPLAIVALRFGLRGATLATLLAAIALATISLYATASAVASRIGLIDDATRFLPHDARDVIVRNLSALAGADLWLLLISLGWGFVVLALLILLIAVLADPGRNRAYLLQERAVRRLLRYFSPDVAHAILASALEMPLTRKEVTILFADLRGFTRLSERLEPEEMSELLNQYLGEMAGIVFKYRGTVDKYMGDAIMAVFGDPQAFPEHAESALRAALEMRDRLYAIRSGWAERGLQGVEIGIGVNTGFVTAGSFGPPERLEYTVIGSSVNVASYLSSTAAPSQILTTSRTFLAVSHLFTGRDLGEVTPKGTHYPVEVTELTGARVSPNSDEESAPWDWAVQLIAHDPSYRALVVIEPDLAFQHLNLTAEEKAHLRLLAGLAGYRLFESVPPREVELVMRCAELERFHAGADIVRQGDTTKSLHIVVSGEVAVLTHDTDYYLRHLATLGPGSYFGELALLFDTPRNATVRAIADVQTIVIKEPVFHQLLEQAPNLAQAIKQEAQRRIAA